MKRPSYRSACSWIADNDEGAEMDPKTISELITVALVSDLFGIDADVVARDVLKRREVRR